jgi:pimeloyl-ACP methyl ester carboxylesterase
MQFICTYGSDLIPQSKSQKLIRIITLITLTGLITGCDNLENKKPTMRSNEIQEVKQDSSSGYELVNGLKMYYEIHGKGTPLVLIHGGGSTIQTTFGQVLNDFAKKRKVIAVELQGHGHTPFIDRPQTFEQDADDVAALLKSLKIESADFFGFSNGGNTTLQIAIRHPELVRKIIVGSAFFKRAGMYPQFWESIKDATLDDMPQQLKEGYKKVAPDSNNLVRMFEQDKNRMVGFKDWESGSLHAITAPTLVISANDDVVRTEHAVEMYRLLPHGQLVILPGTHGEYIGEVETKQDIHFIAATILLIDKFLDEPMPK